MAIRVYLDSSDYSTLSNPQLDQKSAAIRDRLVSWVESGEVEFRYSSAHISEMSPIEPQYSGAAAARSALLVALCGRKAMVSIDEIMRLEIAALANDSGPPVNVYSDTGDWFPSIEDIFPPVSIVDTVKSELERAAREYGANREQRRAAKRQAIKDNKLSKPAEHQLLSNQNSTVREIVQRYPMRDEDARVLHNWLIGKTDAREAEKAFLNSLRDPTWMMHWFAQHSDKLNPVIKWVRSPAERVRLSTLELANAARQAREYGKQLGIDSTAIPGLTNRDKEQIRSKLFSGTSKKLADAIGISLSDDAIKDEDRFARNAIGLTVGINSAVDSMWNSLSVNPRKPKDSDFVDVAHALYAPYVDVFRADGYMAPIIARASKFYGTKVVGKLNDLVTTIEIALEERRLTQT